LNLDLSATCGTTASLVVADFNKDGKDDLAIGAAVLLSSGGGAFLPPICNTILPNFVADFNHDGIPDLATLGRGATIFLGKGDGTFSESASYSSSLQAPAVAADFNGDGNLDLAGPALDNNVTVVLGNGDGTLQSPPTLATYDITGVVGLTTTGVAATDLRSDSKTDLVLFGESGSGVGFVVTYLGNGNGSFQAPVVSGAGNMTSSGAVGDFNHDGKPDVAVTGFSDIVAVLLGNGDGTFQSEVQYNTNLGGTLSVIGVGDFNGDGKQDLVVAGSTSNDPSPGAPGTIEFLLGNGDGTFGFPTGVATDPSQVVALAVGDFNGDGTSDVAVATVGGISIFLGNTSGTFLGLAGTPTALAVADFNQDGKLDLAVTLGAPASQVQIFLGNGDGTFSSTGTFVTGTNPNSIVAADFNGDGKLDLATTGSDGLSILVGNGDGTFQSPINYDSALNPANLAAADFNGDGKTDIALLSGAGVALFLTTTGSNSPLFSLYATSPTTMTINAGQTATFTSQVSPAGSFVGPVALSCTGAPATTTCSVSASSVTFQGATSDSFTVIVTTTANGSLLPVIDRAPLSPLSHLAPALGVCFFALLFGIFSSRRQLSLKWGALAAVLSLVLISSACGGGSGSGSGGHPPPTNGTPSGSFQVTVNASAGNVTQSIKLTVTVQ
jgi:hypothetical protein